VLVGSDGMTRVFDFGIAKAASRMQHTADGQVKGKLRYMAPEHLAGQSHSPTVDLYAVGAMLHEMLDGRKFRHDAEDQVQLYHQVMTGKVPTVQSEVPRELDELRLALLQPDAKKRPQTADAALLMLKRWPGYSEMRVELGMICGMMTGIVRPRTGPMITGGMMPSSPSAPNAAPPISGTASTADLRGDAPPSALTTDRAPLPTEVLDPEVLRAQRHPKSEPTVAMNGQVSTGPHGAEPAHVDARDLEPTHSSIVGPASDPGPWGSTPQSDATISRILVPSIDEPRRSRGWVALLAGAAALALLAGGGTAWLLASERDADDDARVLAVEPKPAPSSGSSTATEAPLVAGPTLSPVATKSAPVEVAAPGAVADPSAIESEPAATPIEPATPAVVPTAPADVAPSPASTPASPAATKPTSTTKKPGASKPSVTPSKPEPAPTGAPVSVHFRLEGGLEYAEVKIGGVLMKIEKRFQSRVASGKHTVSWRVRDGKWKSSKLMLDPGAEWKIWVGSSGVRAEKL
jgi:hypothetical protein